MSNGRFPYFLVNPGSRPASAIPESGDPEITPAAS